MSADQECRRVIFHGRVQGVGFRYTTHRIARSFAVTGFVRNLADGTVELIASGTAREISRFVDAVKAEFAGNIDSVDETTAEATEFTSFDIRR
jgi:acylphosphatase